MLQKVAEGSLIDLRNIGTYESQFAEGQIGQIDLHLRWDPGDTIINALRSQLISRGVVLTGPITKRSGSCVLSIPFKKTIAPLIIFFAVISVAIGIAVIMVSWGLYKKVEEINPTTFGWQMVLVIGLAIVAVAVVYVLLKKPGAFKAAVSGGTT